MLDIDRAKRMIKDSNRISVLAKNDLWYVTDLDFETSKSIIHKYLKKCQQTFTQEWDAFYFNSGNYSFQLSEKDFEACERDVPYPHDSRQTVEDMFRMALIGALLMKLSDDYDFEIPVGSSIFDISSSFYEYDSIKSYG